MITTTIEVECEFEGECCLVEFEMGYQPAEPANGIMVGFWDLYSDIAILESGREVCARGMLADGVVDLDELRDEAEREFEPDCEDDW